VVVCLLAILLGGGSLESIATTLAGAAK